MARRPCSKRVPDSAETEGEPNASLSPAARGGPERNGTTSSRTARSEVAATYAAAAYGSQRRSSEQRVRIPFPGRGVPPVLDVALGELPAGGAQEVLARQVRPDEEEREDVLELIAESVGAARLVVARARPEPAGEVLVEEPAVHEEVEGVVGRRDLDGRDVSSQNASTSRSSSAAASGPPVPAYFATSARASAASFPCPRRRRSGASRPARGRPPPGSRRRGRARPRRGRTAGGGAAPRRARASRSVRETPGGRPWPRERPLAAAKATRARPASYTSRARIAPLAPSRSVTTKRGLPGRGGPSAQSLYAKTLKRRVRPETFVSVRIDSFTGSARATNTASSCAMPSACRAKRVTPAPWRITQRAPPPRPAERPRRRAPERAALLVPQEDRLARGVRHGVVRERRQPVLAAVLRPRGGRPRRRDEGAEGRVRDHVAPGERRLLFSREGHDVLAAVAGEPAEAVRHDERRRFERSSVTSSGGALRPRARGERLRLRQVHLLRELPALAVEHDTGHGREKNALGLRHRVAAQEEDARGAPLPAGPRAPSTTCASCSCSSSR